MKKYMLDTLDYYDRNAESYFETWNTEFLNHYEFNVPDIFLNYLKFNAFILDFGCGMGRDSLYFKKKGYQVKAIDGSSKMCKLASQMLGEEVEQISFLDIDYKNQFDGIFACASLLHLNDQDLTSCLEKLMLALKKEGILYVSFKYGEGERVKENRYFNDMTEEKFKKVCSSFPSFQFLKVWISDAYGSHQKFINFILKKVEK